MERYEMAELLSKKAGVTLEEAREALAANEWDLLDAMVALERRGRTDVPTVTVDAGGSGYSEPQPVKSAPKKDPLFTNGFAAIWHYIKRFFKLLVETNFQVIRKEESIFFLPTLVLVLLLLCCFWIVVPALILGLFVGCSYRFEGPKAADAANRAMDKLGDVVENIKDTLDAE